MDAADATVEPEYDSLESFVEFSYEDDRVEFTGADLVRLAGVLRQSTGRVREQLEQYGLRLAFRAKEKHVRGFLTSSHDRFYGPGSSKSHGGSGQDSICGLVGRKG